MIFNMRFFLVIVSLWVLQFNTGCSGDADKFRQAVIAGNLDVQELVVIPDNRFLNAGETLQFTATAKLENGSSTDLTKTVSWSSSDAAIASVDSSGLSTAKQDGSAVISARFADHVASVPLNVLTANLIGIEIQGPTQVDKCRGVQFKAVGQYDAGPVRPNIDVAWSVNGDQSLATISNEEGSKGLLKTTQSGSFSVVATQGEISQTRDVTSNDNLTAVAVDSASIAKNNTQQLVATATYQDAGTEDISTISTWTSDNAGVASVDSTGGAKGVAAGSAQITAACGGIQGSAAITVTAESSGDTLKINDNKDITLKQNEEDEDKLQLTLWLITDSDTKKVTKDANWSVDNDVQSAITVSNVGDSKGKMTINGVGTTLVTATYEEKTARISVTIEPEDS